MVRRRREMPVPSSCQRVSKFLLTTHAPSRPMQFLRGGTAWQGVSSPLRLQRACLH